VVMMLQQSLKNEATNVWLSISAAEKEDGLFHFQMKEDCLLDVTFCRKGCEGSGGSGMDEGAVLRASLYHCKISLYARLIFFIFKAACFLLFHQMKFQG